MNFTLDESRPWDISITESYSTLDNPDDPTPDDIIKLLLQHHEITSVRHDDSPEFKALRNQLEADGYIECQRGWWNGDRVLRPFALNDVTFVPGDKFCCGSAMQHHLKFTREYTNK
jgi:hypothetical protein